MAGFLNGTETWCAHLKQHSLFLLFSPLQLWHKFSFSHQQKYFNNCLTLTNNTASWCEANQFVCITPYTVCRILSCLVCRIFLFVGRCAQNRGWQLSNLSVLVPQMITCSLLTNSKEMAGTISWIVAFLCESGLSWGKWWRVEELMNRGMRNVHMGETEKKRS